MLRPASLLLILMNLCAFAQPGTITVDGLERTYTLRLPSSYNGSTPMPLVIAMHGGFGSGTQLENQSQLTPKGESEGFILVYPDGYPSPINIRTWNAGGCCGYAMNQNINDVGYISALLDQIIATHNIDTLRIYATGMSNGGFMSYRLACELSDRIAAIAPVSASMTIESCQPVRPVPVISFHSFLDTSVPWQGGIGDGISNHYNSPQDSVLNAFAVHANCTVLNDTVQHDAAMTVIRWHDCDCGAEVIAITRRMAAIAGTAARAPVSAIRLRRPLAPTTSCGTSSFSTAWIARAPVSATKAMNARSPCIRSHQMV
ncbi:MAG: phospholipase [Flavobacteriales bacterium]|nr:phospholipase [Flavobacteriales bacterium]